LLVGRNLLLTVITCCTTSHRLRTRGASSTFSLGLSTRPLDTVGFRLDHVGRSAIARILKAAGIPPARQRPMVWRTFLQAHGPALVAADFFMTEVWTARAS
jgi:hypothetical protein